MIVINILSVSALTRYIKSILESDTTLRDVMVRGEISNFKRHYSGHCYFTLKDSDSTLKAVMFRGRAQFLKFEPHDGLKVIAGGNISLFERDGQYQLYVQQLIPEGMGELSLAFAQLRDKLAAEGLFDEIRKKELPFLPSRVGIVTSPTGAAIRDIVTVAKRRYPRVQLMLYPVQVQGPDSPEQVARGIRLLNQSDKVDVIIVGRGGGSIEELWSFNDEKVVRAIAASSIPVVSAVGHQTDYTLADFVADRRAATPSQAAELVVPDVKELTKYIITLSNSLETNVLNMVASRRYRLEACLSSRVFQQPELILTDKRQLLDGYIQIMQDSLRKTLLTKRHQFHLAAEKMAMLNPLAVLERGYSIVRTYDKHLIRRTGEVVPGERLEIVLTDGTIRVEVLESDGSVDDAKKADC
ncbi:MAG: Exodeoxyribonuclease 7 large subunit [Firmicutes bacterium]|nr:Exodeoxyribonuclease 7 large subunit [Bacillota bacterium]